MSQAEGVDWRSRSTHEIGHAAVLGGEGDNRGQDVPEWRTPAARFATSELIGLLRRSGWTYRGLAREVPCSKSALANYDNGSRWATPGIIQGLIEVLARTLPNMPTRLAQWLVLHQYDLTPALPVFRWDTVILEVPDPDLWLRGVPPGLYGIPAPEAQGIITEVWMDKHVRWHRRHASSAPSDGRFTRYFRETMGGLRDEFVRSSAERHPLEPAPRGLRISLHPFNAMRSDIWFRVQFSPLDPDHRWFVGQLKVLLGDGWRHVRVARLDAAYDFRGTVQRLAPVFEGRHKQNEVRSEWVDGTEYLTIGLGSRRSPLYLRYYQRPVRSGAPLVVRAELEWKPKRPDRPLLMDLPSAPFPLKHAIELLPVAYLARSPEDRALLTKLAHDGLQTLSKSEQAQVSDFRAVARQDEVSFDFTASLRARWAHGLAALRDLLDGPSSS